MNRSVTRHIVGFGQVLTGGHAISTHETEHQSVKMLRCERGKHPVPQAAQLVDTAAAAKHIFIVRIKMIASDDDQASRCCVPRVRQDRYRHLLAIQRPAVHAACGTQYGARLLLGSASGRDELASSGGSARRRRRGGRGAGRPRGWL